MHNRPTYINDVPVLNVLVTTVNTTRDLVTMAAHFSTVFCSEFFNFRLMQLHPVLRS